MITIVLVISLLSQIYGQQTRSWSPYPIPSQASGFQQLFLEPSYSPSLYPPSFQAHQEYVPQSAYPSSLIPRSDLLSTSPTFQPPVPSYTYEETASPIKQTGSQTPLAPNLSQKMSELLSKITETLPSTPKAPMSFEPKTYSSLSNGFVPSAPLTSTSPSLTSAPSFQMPPPVVSSSKTPRLMIPSPLIDNNYPLYSNSDPFANMFDLPEPSISSVGCLDLTMTPYGTISETPLPNPLIALPRSPLLPVSSPVSALAPSLSPLLPPASLASSNTNFLRKIPIPPPFI